MPHGTRSRGGEVSGSPSFRYRGPPLAGFDRFADLAQQEGLVGRARGLADDLVPEAHALEPVRAHERDDGFAARNGERIARELVVVASVVVAEDDGGRSAGDGAIADRFGLGSARV